MVDASLAVRMGITRSRLVLIGILGLVLIGVVVLQTGSGDAPVKKITKRAPRRLRPLPKTSSQAAKKPVRRSYGPAATGVKKRWPKMNVDLIVQNDPFAMPEALRPMVTALPPTPPGQAPPDVERRSNALQELLKKGVDMVLVTEHGKVAKIGDRLLRVGDVIDGFRIRDITSQGIVVDVDAPATQGDR